MQPEYGKDFVINQYGEIVHNGPVSEKTPAELKQDALNKEYDKLYYEIFSHPERFTPRELDIKKERYAELEKILGYEQKTNALRAGKEILKKRMAEMQMRTAALHANDDNSKN